MSLFERVKLLSEQRGFSLAKYHKKNVTVISPEEWYLKTQPNIDYLAHCKTYDNMRCILQNPHFPVSLVYANLHIRWPLAALTMRQDCNPYDLVHYFEDRGILEIITLNPNLDIPFVEKFRDKISWPQLVSHPNIPVKWILQQPEYKPEMTLIFHNPTIQESELCVSPDGKIHEELSYNPALKIDWLEKYEGWDYEFAIMHVQE